MNSFFNPHLFTKIIMIMVSDIYEIIKFFSRNKLIKNTSLAYAGFFDSSIKIEILDFGNKKPKTFSLTNKKQFYIIMV